MIKKVWKIIAPILSAIIGVLAANKLNIFSFLPFVPDEYAYEICITAYFAVMHIIIDAFTNGILNFIKNRFISELEVVISQQGTNINIGTDTFLEFNNDDLTEANVLVKIKGRKNHFKNIDLIIKKPAFAEIQNTYRRPEATVNRDNYCIKLESLFGNSDIIDSSQTFKIAMIQDPVDGDTSVILSPELSKKKFGLVYKHNNVHLKAVRR